MKKRYAVLISYIGTHYCGWQIQAAASGEIPSIQEVCEATLAKITGTRVHWQASGRTDSGVHAMGQVAHFTVDWGAPNREGKKELSPYQFVRAMNTLLPSHIRILAVKEAPADFHSQKSAKRKQYSYYFQIATAPSAVHEPLTAFYYKPLDVPAMQEAVKCLLGEHDFKVFRAAGAQPHQTTIRTLYEAEVSELKPDGPFGFPLANSSLVRIRVVGNGFLRHMVRGIAGTLFEIGKGERPASDMAEILRSGERSLVGKTALAARTVA